MRCKGRQIVCFDPSPGQGFTFSKKSALSMGIHGFIVGDRFWTMLGDQYLIQECRGLYCPEYRIEGDFFHENSQFLSFFSSEDEWQAAIEEHFETNQEQAGRLGYVREGNRWVRPKERAVLIPPHTYGP